MNTEKTSIVDYLAQLVALTASASLVASLSYDWGFFYTIGISFHDLPTSLSDHARTALDWAPTVAAGAFLYLFFELLTRRIEQGKTEAEILARSSSPSRLRKFRESPRVLAWLFVIGCPISYVILRDAELDGLKVALMAGWVAFCLWVLKTPRIKERWQKTTQVIVLFVPAICIWFWIAGRVDAIKLYDALPSTAVTYTANLAKVERVTILRYFDKGVLLREQHGPICFREWSSVARIEMDTKFKGFKGVAHLPPQQ